MVANVSKPAGLSPVKTLSGSPWTGKGNVYYIASNNGSAFYLGDLVVLSGTGDSTRGIPGIALATAGNPAVGVIMGAGVTPDGAPYANPANLNTTAVPATKTQAWYAYVADDPNLIFEIQESGSATNLTAAAIGLNANIVYGAPAAGVVVSGTTLDNNSVDVTSTLNLKILSLVRRLDNGFSTSPATTGAGQKWNVLINNHCYRSGITGL